MCSSVLSAVVRFYRVVMCACRVGVRTLPRFSAFSGEAVHSAAVKCVLPWRSGFFAALQRVSCRVATRFTALGWVSTALQCVLVCFCRVAVRFRRVVMC